MKEATVLLDKNRTADAENVLRRVIFENHRKRPPAALKRRKLLQAVPYGNSEEKP